MYGKEVTMGTLGIMDNGFMYWYEPLGRGYLLNLIFQAMALAGTTLLLF